MTTGRDRIAVVIPVLNEAARIATQLRDVTALDGIDEVLVVDGGSQDDTAALAAAVPRTRVLQAPRGRGPQLAAGADATDADVVIFLHADVRLPPDAAAHVCAALAAADVVGGAFRVRTVNDGAPSWVDPLLPLADVRARLTRLPYGDQAMFVRRTALRRIGGVPQQPMMEDLELSRRLRRIGRLVTVPAAVTVSGRRFVQDPLRAVIAMRVLPLLYRLGVSPARLAAWYGDPR